MKLLFVCSSNSVRSQIAEGWACNLGRDKIKVRSAGISPFPVHPMAVATMKEIGIDISRQRNRQLDDRTLAWPDFIITLSEAVRPYSVFFPKSVRYDHWSIPNPDTLVSDDTNQAQAYRIVRDIIKRRVAKLLDGIEPI